MSHVVDELTGSGVPQKGRNGAAVVTPRMAGGAGHLALQTSAVAGNYVTFASQACSQLTIVNDTGLVLEVLQDGAGVALPVFQQQPYTFFGITNANQLSVRRADQSATPVTVRARWEV